MKGKVNFSGRSLSTIAKSLAANRKAVEGTQKVGQQKQIKVNK